MTRATARTRANRRNALKSTGPRKAEGKAHVARNALVHGFCSVRRAEVTPRIERLARRIAGPEADPERFALALEVAAADDAVRCARRARHMLMQRPPVSTMLARIEAVSRVDRRASRLIRLLIERLSLSHRVYKGRPLKLDNYPRFRNLKARLTAQLERWTEIMAEPLVCEHDGILRDDVRLLARYEGEAMRRRKQAILGLDAYRARSASGPR